MPASQSHPGRRGRRARQAEAVLGAISLFALAVLAFVGGSVLTSAGVTPGPQIGRAYSGAKALVDKATKYDDVFRSDLWQIARTEARGVTLHRPESDPGPLLYSSPDQPQVQLIDREGRELYRWRKPYSEVWEPGISSVKKPQPDTHVHIRRAQIGPDGSLLALYEGAGDTPYGYGVVKLDRHSNVLWRFLENAHHDFSVAPDGRIAVLTQRVVDRTDEPLGNVASPRLEDYIVILSPDGRKLKEIRLLPLVYNSPYKQFTYLIASYSASDPLHANSVHVITEEDARRFRFGRPGQLLVSFRELAAIAVIDPDSAQMVWAQRAYWVGQHDPKILPNGNVLLFDNYGDWEGPTGRSRAIEFDPATMQIVWQYRGTPDRPLDSTIRSHVQRLPGGNTLITESNGGRIVEVTPDGEPAWEFVNPVRGGPDGNLIPVIVYARRVDDTELSWLARTPTRVATAPRKEIYR